MASSVVVLIVIVLASCTAWKVPTPRMVRTAVQKTIASVGLATLILPLVVMGEEKNVLAQQLQLLQTKNSENQAVFLAQKDQEMLTKELLMADGQLIARGVIMITCDNIDQKVFPLGFISASDLDASFDSASSRLFVLAVGREGSIPLAAKSYPLKDLQFPLVWELEAKDLLFPYTKEAWLTSGNRADTIAVSAFITPNAKIGLPSSSVRVGFGLSDPLTMAGKLTRSSAQIRLGPGRPLDVSLFTQAEIDLLAAVDAGIERNLKSAEN